MPPNSGDTDAVLPLTATRYSINALKLKTVTEWYPWYDNQKVSERSNIQNSKAELPTKM